MELNVKIDNGLKLTIGTMAEALNVTQETLRTWDKENILPPKRSETNRRYYTLNDIKKGNIIKFMTRNLLLNLSGVKIVLTMLEDDKIELDEQEKYLEKLAQKAGFSKTIQEENILKVIETTDGSKLM